MKDADFQQCRITFKSTIRHLPLFCGVLSTGVLSLGIIPPEELEEVKPQLGVTQSGGNLVIDWATHPEVFYFMEGTPDLRDGFWVTAKLLKDNDESGSLTLGTAISSDHVFFRISMEGDRNAARLRADDDGDGVINLLEVEAGWDAFLAEEPTDSDSDGIPDYFEQFHFGTLAHDGSYVAAAGGLSLSTAFANATDPTSIDSDGDGWSDKQELEWGWNPNYDQSRDDGSFSQNGDNDGDGFSNISESLNGTNAGDQSDFPLGVTNKSYALIDLGQYYLPHKVGNLGHVFLEEVNYYSHYRRWHWGEVLDFDKEVDDWEAEQLPFLPFYELNSMNNNGQIGGVYQSQPSARSVVLAGSCGGNPAYADLYYQFRSPVIIEADGSVTVAPIPELTTNNHQDTESHEIIALNDNGAFVVRSFGYTTEMNGMPTPNARRHEVHKYVGGVYSNMESISTRAFAVLEGSCDQVMEYSGEYPAGLMINNANSIVGFGRESLDWTSSSTLDDGNSFYFSDTTNNRLDYAPATINQNGLILGNDNGIRRLYSGSNQYALPPSISASHMTSPQSNEPLTLISNTHIAVQKRDAISSNLLPLSDGSSAYFVQTAEEILHRPNQAGQSTKNEEWSGLWLTDISDNGAFIVGIANNSSTGAEHAVMLLKVDLEIEDEHFADNIMDTAETDDELEQFIMARESSLNPDPFEITIRPSDALAGISKTRYRLVSPNETGGVDEFDGPFTAEVTGLTVNYHNDEPAELHVGIDMNGNNELDESEYLKTVPIHPLYWNVTGTDSEEGLGQIQTVPSDVLLWEAAGELTSYLYDNQFKTIITGPVDGLGLIVRYTSTEDADDWFEETIGGITPEGSKVADLEQVFYEFPSSEGGSGITEEVLLSNGVRMVYSEPTVGGTRNPIDETIWNQLWSNYSYGVVHNDDIAIEVKREERAGIYKKVLAIPIVGPLIKKEGQALRQFHSVLEDRHGVITGDINPIDTTITVKEYDTFYKKLIEGARMPAKYLSIVGAEEMGGFKGLSISGDNMEWWVRGTQRTGYNQTGQDGFPSDYKVLDYQEFSSKSFIQERIKKYLIGWPVKNQNAGTTMLESILSDSRLTLGNLNTPFAYTERSVQINVNDYDSLSDMQDLARALGTFSIRAVNSDTLSAQGISGGTWEIEQVSGSNFNLKIKVKLEVVDRYDWHLDSAFDIPVPDGESPNELRVWDNWQLYYETLSGNYLGGQAKPFDMGTKYEWAIIQVDVPLVYTGGNLQLATPVETE